MTVRPVEKWTHPVIVVAITPDGGVVVYGERADVVIINVLATDNKESEVLAESLSACWLKERHKEVYLDATKVLAIGHVHCRSVRKYAEAISRQQISKIARLPAIGASAANNAEAGQAKQEAR